MAFPFFCMQLLSKLLFMSHGGSVRSYGASVCCYSATIFSYSGSVAENGATILRYGGTIQLNVRARTYVHIYIVAILTFYVSHLSHLSLFPKATGTHGTDGTLIFGFNILPRAGACREVVIVELFTCLQTKKMPRRDDAAPFNIKTMRT